MDEDTSALNGIRELFARLVEQTSTREDVVRLDERQKQFATREEVNNGDLRTLQEVSTMFDRSTAVNQQFVRDRVEESALKTANALQGLEKSSGEKIQSLEKSIGEKISATDKSIDGVNTKVAAIATAIAEMRQQLQPTQAQIGRLPQIVPWGGGFGLGGLIVYLLLAFFGFAPRPGG